MRTKAIVAVLSFFLFGLHPGKHTDFSGTWKLDLDKSVHLPASFKYVETYLLEIRQTADSIVTTVHMTGGGQVVTFPLTSYALNGSEVYRADEMRRSKRWITCSWGSAGKEFIVNSRVEQDTGAVAKKYTQKDVWKLSDPNTLQMSMVQSARKGAARDRELRIFHRVKE
jgi:hypothetical protein